MLFYQHAQRCARHLGLLVCLALPFSAQAQTPTLSSEAQSVFDLAAEIYPTLFKNGSAVQLFQGYTYRYFAGSGIYVGVKDNRLFVMGGQFGSGITDLGTVTAVLGNLQATKAKQTGSNSAQALSVDTVATGLSHSCVITSTQTVRCWGANLYGEVGDGTTTRRSSPVSVINLPTATPTAITAGGNVTCLRTNDGAARCWGRNDDGLVGDGTGASRSTPTLVSGLTSGVKSIEAGGNSVCAVLDTGAVRCWGLNTYGQLGDGSRTSRLSPVAVSGVTGATAVAVGDFHACAIVQNGAVKCWGRNHGGQLGNDSTTDSPTPVDVAGISGAVQISLGSTHSCARFANGTVQCWGKNNQMQVGSFLGVDKTTPINVGVTLNNRIAANLGIVSTGDAHGCAINRPGTGDANEANMIYCWGNNADRQLGDNVQTSAQIGGPAAVASGYAAVMSGSAHNCAITLSGALHCWGRNSDGQLGLGTTTRTGVPTVVPGITMTVPTL